MYLFFHFLFCLSYPVQVLVPVHCSSPSVFIGRDISLVLLSQVRNSSTLLFSTLITRIFGVKKGKDERSKKNRCVTALPVLCVVIKDDRVKSIYHTQQAACFKAGRTLCNGQLFLIRTL